ncbi:hypothetical protein Misp01_47070 [Microtetraspora sp. NBRC 13810]|uniref:hypothetical protein n=1 Tax=Microtetraspora sp. NBRC 13810 TaxID=3030990 RepID=UPI00249FE489|nr:hypothetical protein [Microtetraspora sp. NBRC 13810]GLW09578.1 hypothetical protein Misp01_47070 [Microtetraspora sp. NBRC 13810]
MGPELHYQMIHDRVSELHEQASAHRIARQAAKSRKAPEGAADRRHRFAFKLRAS